MGCALAATAAGVGAAVGRGLALGAAVSMRACGATTLEACTAAVAVAGAVLVAGAVVVAGLPLSESELELEELELFHHGGRTRSTRDADKSEPKKEFLFLLLFIGAPTQANKSLACWFFWLF